jgi:glycosyltransferase involved in cell wall biosynthesis
MKGLKKTSAGFWVYSPFSLPVHHIACARPVNTSIISLQMRLVSRRLEITNPIIWVACPAACDVALNMNPIQLVYQRTDRFEAYPNVDSEVVRYYDKKLKAAAALTLFVSSSLYRNEAENCRKALYLDHGVDYAMFASAHKAGEIPSDLASIPRPIAGFFGGVDNHTCDISFVKKVVELLPRMSFVFVGSASADIRDLEKRKNVWLLGQKPYEQIPYYGSCFDVAIMPWRQNSWIDACNPVKLKEYLALGKPIVSTPFPELQKYRDIVYEAETPQEFSECLVTAVAEDNSVRIAARRKRVEQDTWDAKARKVLKILSPA